ncbi:MAG: hypothetical protein II820_02755 [Ruminiclostridium sp.]|nr:hypothetical protein [Ruminiclostridium sp.]
MPAEKKRHRVLKVLLWIVMVLAALALILFIIFHRWLFAALRISGGVDALNKGSEGMTYTERSMTTEQMLTDFDFLYKTVVTDSLTTPQWEKYLKIDYNELYDTFRPRIENCKDEFEFYSVMTSFMARLPGGHTFLHAPTDDMVSQLDFPLFWELGYDDVIKTNYDYWVKLEDRMWSYPQKTAVAGFYGGDYIFTAYDGGNGYLDDIVNGKLLTLNGEPVSEAIRKLDTIYSWTYDSHNDSVRVYALIFNDGIGEKYEAEIEMPDGSIVTKTLYNSAEYNVSIYYRNKRYPNHNKAPAEEVTEAETTAPSESDTPSGSESEPEAAPVQKSYTIETDEARRLVYVRTTTCLGSEVESVFEDITAAIGEVDAENIIIDVKSNGGGDYNFVTDGICRAIFDKPVGWINYSHFPKAKVPQIYLDFLADMNDQIPEDKGDYMQYYEDYTVNGEAKGRYNIYILTSNSTFSSGDILAAITAEQDNVTVIGENTAGEGFSGNPLNYYLPESKFFFAFAPGVSDKLPENNILGTEADIYCPNRWEEYLKFIELRDDPEIGSKISTYEYRRLWDRPVAEALKLIDGISE